MFKAKSNCIKDGSPIEAIIQPEVFEMVQHELTRRKSSPARHSGTGIFSGKIVCGDCGSFYGAKVWHSTDKYRKVVYRCNRKFDNERKCQTPHLDAEQIKRLFISALNILFSKRDELTANFKEIRHIIFSTTELDVEIDSAKAKMTVVGGIIEKLIHENAHSIINQDEYNRKYNELTARHEAILSRHDELVRRRIDLLIRKKAAERFFSELSRQPQSVTEFYEHIWHTLLDFVTVYSKDDVRFTFSDGSVVQVGTTVKCE